MILWWHCGNGSAVSLIVFSYLSFLPQKVTWNQYYFVLGLTEYHSQCLLTPFQFVIVTNLFSIKFLETQYSWKIVNKFLMNGKRVKCELGKNKMIQFSPIVQVLEMIKI